MGGDGGFVEEVSEVAAGFGIAGGNEREQAAAEFAILLPGGGPLFQRVAGLVTGESDDNDIRTSGFFGSKRKNRGGV